MTIFVECPPHIRSVDVGTATVLLDTRSGQVDLLLGDLHETWGALAPTGGEEGVSSTSQQSIDKLVRRRLLNGAPRPRPWVVASVAPSVPSWGTDEDVAAVEPRIPTPLGRTLGAGVVLMGVLLVRATGRRSRSFDRTLRVVSAAQRLARRNAATVEAEQAVRCVRNAARVLPFRVACLEESTAAVLLLAAGGRRADWCHGVAADPIQLHAWIALKGVAVAEPVSTDRYTTLIRFSGGATD